ncbi:hypothetical protein [Candidatus Nanohalobium constans]|uniref:Ribbon-helix-helix protein CopG domain-containing protein n=1 Tax=Candidatus Nanohalobium constans TaxID=2565781 RepID=A0A5Q0UGV3_9ARCH|nr:hypothetical protein [Candidatus Nanohalobium constans]QGA80882.1 hypothetical protein LC1Nh_1006 [Candidatus Nanohalobium constans]
METDDNNVRIGAKLEKSVLQTLRGFCDARGENISTVIRRSIRRELASHSYLSDSEKKALGVETDDGQ